MKLVVAQAGTAQSAPSSEQLLLLVEPGLGGAWTERIGDGEVIRFGIPVGPQARWFRVDRPHHPIRHTVLSLAIERIVHAREITEVIVESAALRHACERALRVHPSVRLTVRERAPC
jgi:hypothetical protein